MKDGQISFFPEPDSCYSCRCFAELKEPWELSGDRGKIYGYCFKGGDKDYSPSLGKGFPVYIDEGICKEFKRKKDAR